MPLPAPPTQLTALSRWARRAAASIALAAIAASCGYTPARYVDVPAATAVADAKPIAMPVPRLLLDAFDVADAYLRQSVSAALDPSLPGKALDVNALDEVVDSSWWSKRDTNNMLDGYRTIGPPAMPLTTLTDAPVSHRPGARRVRDKNGAFWEVLPDPADRQGLYSTAGVVASRLLFALGYRVPESYPVELAGKRWGLAVAWPAGTDLGPTPPSSTRFDDPNDTISRKDRRSLRSLPRALAWLGKSDLDVGDLRDGYIGESPRGYVLHFVTGLAGALGVDALEAHLALMNDDNRPAESAKVRIITLGLAAPNALGPPKTDGPGLGIFHDDVDVEEAFAPSPPFEPLRFVTPADDLWIGMKLAALPIEIIEEALRATPLSQFARDRVTQRLDRRRRAVAAWCLIRGTPLTPASIGTTSDGLLRIALTDNGIARRLSRSDRTTYLVQLYDGEGEAIDGSAEMTKTEEGLELAIKSVINLEYVVARVTATRGSYSLRPMEVHVALGGGKPPRVVGVAH